MTSRLSDHFSMYGLVFFVLEPLLGIARQWSCMEFAISTPNAQSHGRIQEARGLLNGNINTGVFSFCNWEEANNKASIEILNRNAPFNDALLTLRVNQSNHLSQRPIFPTSSTACSTVQYIHYLPNMQRGPLIVFDTLACDCICKGQLPYQKC